MTDLDFFENPTSVAVVGASEDPEKIGGRPLHYLREFGFTGRVFPVCPNCPNAAVTAHDRADQRALHHRVRAVHHRPDGG